METEHNPRTKINLHNEFKYIYGYLEVNGKEQADFDYIPDDAMYKMHAKLLEKTVSIICNFVFKISPDNGAINANMTAEQLGMNVCNALNEQVKDIGSHILELYYYYVSKKLIPSEEELELALAKLLKDFIMFKETEHDESDPIPRKRKYSRCKIDDENENILPKVPDSSYKWEERVDTLGIKKILENIKSKHSKAEEESCEKNIKLREKFWEDYLSQRGNYKTDKEYVRAWCNKRNTIITEGEVSMSESTGIKMLSSFKANEGVVYTKKGLVYHQKSQMNRDFAF